MKVPLRFSALVFKLESDYIKLPSSIIFQFSIPCHEKMPPRLLLRLSRSGNAFFSPLASTSSIPSFLLPFLHSPGLPQSQPHLQSQTRHASILTSLRDRPGAYNKKIRRGRGPASGKGGKSGRGSDGQKQHSKVPAGFNGGQTPEHIVHGKYGFKNA